MKHLYKENLINFLNSKFFKIVFLCILLITLYSYFAYGLVLNKEFNLTYLDKYININTSIWFFSISYIFLIIFIEIYIIKKYINNFSLISRFENKKKFLKFIKNNILIINTIVYLISQILIFIMLNVTINTFDIKIIKEYNITNLEYSFYLFFKTYLLMISISLVNLSLLNFVKEKITIIFNIILFSYMTTSFLKYNTVSHIYNMSFYVFDYIVGCKYTSFKLELLCLLIFNIMIIFMSIIINIISEKNRRGVV